jgi:thiosulfate dehydrogenase
MDLIVVLFLAAGGMLLINAAPAEAQNGTDPLILGARLYADWIAETGQPAPSGNQPLWSTHTTTTSSGADTWRCAACHGWDYQGADGAYSSGANFTGFPGVYPAREKSSAELLSVLTGGTNADHDFSSFLSDSELEALVTFIQSGLVNDSEFIDRATLKVIDGDAAHGETLYSRPAVNVTALTALPFNSARADRWLCWVRSPIRIPGGSCTAPVLV